MSLIVLFLIGVVARAVHMETTVPPSNTSMSTALPELNLTSICGTLPQDEDTSTPASEEIVMSSFGNLTKLQNETSLNESNLCDQLRQFLAQMGINFRFRRSVENSDTQKTPLPVGDTQPANVTPNEAKESGTSQSPFTQTPPTTEPINTTTTSVESVGTSTLPPPPPPTEPPPPTTSPPTSQPPPTTEAPSVGNGILPLYVLRLLAKYVVSKRVDDCQQRSGFYSQSLGVCIIGLQDNGTNFGNDLLKSLNLISADARWHITVVCSTLSLAALVLVLFVYGTISELQTVPGKNIMCLASCMMGGHVLELLTIIPDLSSNGCRTIGVLLHWSYLMMLTWTSIIAFHLAKTFITLTVQPLDKRRTFQRYCIISFAVPTVVVLAHVIVDVTTNPRLIGYGLDHYCFVTRFWPSLAYIIIVMLVMLFNLVCVILTIRAVYVSRASNQRVLRKDSNSRSQFFHLSLMVLKISTIVGLGWLFGIIGTSVGSSILVYLFLVVLNAQGVLVFVAFLCNRRVFRLVKSHYGKRIQSSSKQQSSNVGMTEVTRDT